MSYTLKNNAYHVLGLDILANEKDILKRSKEIINRLRVGDCPEYDFDIGSFKDFRTEENVQDALQRLRVAKKRIKEYFFWIQVADGIDEQSLGLFKIRDYLNATRIWQNASEGQTTKAFFYKKNLAILYCLILLAENDKQYLRSSLTTWKELIDSENFWYSFVKVYKLHDEQTASDEIINDFKKHVLEYLSDVYTELYQTHKDIDYIYEFQKIFSEKGEEIKKTVLNPVYQAISAAVEKLENMEISKNRFFGKQESETIKQLVGSIQSELNKIIDIGLYNDSQTKIIRDRVANALRTVVLDLHNHLQEFDKSLKLLKVAIQICGTESMKNKLEGEIQQIQNSIKDDATYSLAIEVPGYRPECCTAVFKNSFFEFNNTRIFFKDAIGLSYNANIETRSVYGVPVSTSYTYGWSVFSEKDNVSISLSASKDESREKAAWVQLVGMASNLIESQIIKRIIWQIFDNGETVTIGNIEFTKLGYSKNKFKLFGKKEKEIVYWTDRPIYEPKLFSGNVILYKDKDGKSVQFATIPMYIVNAVIIPGLAKMCFNLSQKHER